MGVFGDTIEEFKKASPQEKIFIVGGGVAAIAIALYIHRQSSSSSPAQGATSASGSLQGGGSSGGGGIQTAPSSSTGNVPILPPGLQGVFDASGNLLAWQPITQSTPVTPSSPGGTKSTSPLGTIWTLPGMDKWQTVGGSQGAPLVPFGFNGGTPSGVTGQQYTYGGKTFTQVAGPGGRIWGAPGNLSAKQAIASPTKELLYAPASTYPVKMGGGPYGTRVASTKTGKGIAPNTEGLRQPSQVARVYAMRGR